MLAVIAQLNNPLIHIPYDYRDGIRPEWDETKKEENENEWVKNWPIYDDDELPHIKNRLEMVCDDALEEGIHAVFTIAKISGTPSALHYDFPYQPMMSDLFEDGAEVFSGGEKITPFSPSRLLSFRPSIFAPVLQDVVNGVMTKEEFETAQLVTEMDVVENTKAAIADAPYNIQIVAINDDYVVYRDSGFEYHKAEIVDDRFMVGELRIGLDECMRR